MVGDIQCPLQTSGFFSTFRPVAGEPYDLEGKSWNQNVPLIICNKIDIEDLSLGAS